MIRSLVLIFTCLITLTSCVQGIHIAASERGVVVDQLTGALEAPLLPGFHLVNTFRYRVIKFPIEREAITFTNTPGAAEPEYLAVEAITVDGQTLNIHYSIVFSVDPEKVNEVYQSWQDRYADFIVPTVRGVIRDTIRQYSVRDIFGVDREIFQLQIKLQLAQRLQDEGFILFDSLIRNVEASPEFTATL